MDEKELLADSITKAIAYQENGGKLDLNNIRAGKSGELKSIFQFTPETWKNYSHQIYGKEVPLNPDTETYIVREKVKKWMDEGKNTSQIASMWNAGEGRPDAYKQNWKGVNKHGVRYDTPKYASNVLNYATKFYTEKSQKAPKITETSQQQPQIVQSQADTEGSNPV